MQLNAYGTNAILITYVHLKQSIMTSIQIPQISSNCNKLSVFLIWQAKNVLLLARSEVWRRVYTSPECVKRVGCSFTHMVGFTSYWNITAQVWHHISLQTFDGQWTERFPTVVTPNSDASFYCRDKESLAKYCLNHLWLWLPENRTFK